MCTTDRHEVRGGPVGVGEGVGTGLVVPAAALALPLPGNPPAVEPAVVLDAAHPVRASAAAPAAAARHRYLPATPLAVSTQPG
jgi:hypothetical protein